MGCIYSNLRDGSCSFWEEGSSLNPEGSDAEGFCIAEEDEDPSWCQSFESDATCWNCGQFLEDCECEED